ncbi:MAG: hypothetical protein U1D00_26475 [Mycobacterium sp.]|nr:hypothetical protein [Mycobacterium sp.]
MRTAHAANDFQRRACQIAVPAGLRELSTLPRVDYADAFRVDTGAHPDWTARDWARGVLEEAPATTRARLLTGWSALGLRSTGSAAAVLGWAIRRSTTEHLLLGRDSRIGMPGELLFSLSPQGLVFATFVHHRFWATRVMWAGIENTHVSTVLELLGRAARGAARGDVKGW